MSEFDEKAANLAHKGQGCSYCWSEQVFVRGARWQFDQLKAKVTALEAELKNAQQLKRAIKDKASAHDDGALAYFVLQQDKKELEALNARYRSALKSARGWVVTHVMQTYSKVAAKEVEEIDALLALSAGEEGE